MRKFCLIFVSRSYLSPLRLSLCALIASIILAISTGTALSAESVYSESGAEPQVHYNPGTLPVKSRETFIRIMKAARSGDLQELRAALEWNELPPETGDENRTDPISFWKKQSSDGSTHDIMARMLDVFQRGYTVHNEDDENAQTTYVWPYLRDKDLNNLKPHEEVDLHRLATPDEVKAMKASGKYSGYYTVIGEDGTWHSFMKNK